MTRKATCPFQEKGDTRIKAQKIEDGKLDPIERRGGGQNTGDGLSDSRGSSTSRIAHDILPVSFFNNVCSLESCRSTL